MRIMVDIGHPAHVHFFKNFIWEMEKRGHEFIVTARDKDVALRLLKAYGIEYTTVGRVGKGKLGLIREWIGRDREIYSIARTFRPDILTGIHNPCVAHVARLIGAKSIIFTDTEHATIANLVTFPFSSVICTPSCFKRDLGKKQVCYNGYHELAYLHPIYYKPDPSVLHGLGIKETDKYIVIRFVAWGASHDIGQYGLVDPRGIISELEPYGRVLTSSEVKLDTSLDNYCITLPPEKLHDLLYYATLCITEGATIASECAVLGTPAIYVNNLRLGYLDEQEERYGLVYNFSNPEVAQKQAVGKALELLQRNDLKEEWQLKRERLLKDKADVTQFISDFIENYPESCNQIRKNQSLQNN